MRGREAILYYSSFVFNSDSLVIERVQIAPHLEAFALKLKNIVGRWRLILEETAEPQNDDLQEVGHLHVESLRNDLQHLLRVCVHVCLYRERKNATCK